MDVQLPGRDGLAGMDAFLCKPLRGERLLATLREPTTGTPVACLTAAAAADGQDPMPPEQFGRFLVLAGLIIVMVGLLVWSGALNWFGRLPGDVRVEKPGFRLYVPWVSLLVVSAAVNLAVFVVRRFLR